MNRRFVQVMGVLVGLMLMLGAGAWAQESGEEPPILCSCLKPFDDVVCSITTDIGNLGVGEDFVWRGLNVYRLKGAVLSVYTPESVDPGEGDFYISTGAVLNPPVNTIFFGNHRLGTFLAFADGAGNGFWKAEFSSHPIVRSAPFITGGTLERCGDDHVSIAALTATSVEEFTAMVGRPPNLAGQESRIELQ